MAHVVAEPEHNRFPRFLFGVVLHGAGGETSQVLEATELVLEPAQRAGVVRADLKAADLVQLVRGLALSAIVPPDRYALLLDVVLNGIRA